ncbi:MAG: T9SS type A sorting domain-containing protein [bacterium]
MSKQKSYRVVILLVLLSICSLIVAQTWSYPERISPYVTGSYIIFSQGLTTDSSGRPWCGWAALTDYSNIYVSHYTDTAWSVPDTIHPFGGFYSCDLATDANGNVWVVANEGYAISACFHNGTSWSGLMQVPTQGTCCHDPVTAGDTLGNLWVCWHGGGPGDGHHIWGNAHIAGQWGSPVLISYPGGHNESAYSMTTDKQGKIWVGWYRFSCPDRAICVSFNDGSSWSDTMMVAGYPHSYFTRGPALTVDTSGRLWAGWFGCDSASNWKVYASYYDENTWSTPVPVSSETAVFYNKIAITSDNAGMVWLTWTNPDTNICFSYWNGNNWSDPVPVDTHPARDYSPKIMFDGERIWLTWIREIGSNTYGIYASYTYGVGVEEERTTSPLQLGTELRQSYPNPFGSKTAISYRIQSDCCISLKIYDIVGNLVRVLVNEHQKAGHYIVSWNGKDNVGTQMPAGIYFLRLETSNKSTTKKIVKLE